MSEPWTPASSDVLAGRYVLEGRIGSGGTGAVWRAHDRVLGRAVAVKLLHAELADDPDATARFRAEATAAARLTHPHTVMVFDIGRHGDRDFLVMELVEGRTLEALLADGPLSPGTVAALGSQLGRALGAAHARGLVHRDVKPANVLVTAAGVPKVTDFGIAHALGDATTRLTASGDVVGTARYLAPEQLRDDPVDPRTDLYALGLLLHHAATGEPPFGEGGAVEVAMRRMTTTLPRVTELRHDVPPALDEVIMRATQLDPDDRFAGAGELVAALVPLAAPDAARELAARVGGEHWLAPPPHAAAVRTQTPARPQTAGAAPERAPQTRTFETAGAPTDARMGASNLRAGAGPASAPRSRPARHGGTARAGRMQLGRVVAVVLTLTVIGIAVTIGIFERTPIGSGVPIEPGVPIEIVAGGDHDPFGSGEEYPDRVPNAYDGDPSTFWRTHLYRGDPELGGLKPGVGIWLDLGADHAVAEVVVSTTNPGGSFTVYAGDAPPSPGESPDDWGAPVASVEDAGAEERIELDVAVASRVWLLWFTSLPPDGDQFRATISDVGFLPG